MVARHIFEAIRGGSGFFQHGHTYLGHPIACAASLAVQKTIQEEGLLARVREMGDALHDALLDRFGNHRHIGDIRGRGLFRAVELVADRGTKEPFDPALKLHSRIKAEAMERGLICYPGGGTIDGARGDHVLLAPPFIIERQHIDAIVDRLGGAIDAALASAAVR
jgi:adenosylmethionine-8-amino-7-oxononanoate aminotransferase